MKTFIIVAFSAYEILYLKTQLGSAPWFLSLSKTLESINFSSRDDIQEKGSP